LLPLFVDGRSPYSLVLDAGATSTVVSDELADALAKPREKNRTAEEQRKNLAAASDFLTRLSAELGSRLQGIVGYDFLPHPPPWSWARSGVSFLPRQAPTLKSS